jgi:adenylate cyclase
VPIDASSELKIEIGHVLMMDVVGYSRMLITQQIRTVQELTALVRATPQFHRVEAMGKLVTVPTGDGMLLVFFDDVQSPISCAVELARAMKSVPELQLRIGVHSGPVNVITDVNERINVAGAGVDLAQRVMNCGDAGHILLSKRINDDLSPFPQWNSHLHELGECEVKHGLKISLVNFYTDDVGNAATPRAFAESAAKSPARGRTDEKSIVVLPFESLSADPENAYFADGIQEEILMLLSKIRGLKVVSRTSTQSYRRSTTNLRAIAQQLGVAHVVEGAVSKSGDQVRVHVQLIAAADDANLWAERYDRKLTDIFAVESDIAKNIAEALRTRLTGEEQRGIDLRPTENPEAHELYLKGLYYWNKFFAPNFQKSREHFERAIEIDPNYALAYAGLSVYYCFATVNGLMDPNLGWAAATPAMGKALRLNPNLAEAYNPKAAVKLYRDRDWPAAERAFLRGIELNPNFAEIRHHYGACLILFEREDEALIQMARGVELQPLSPRFHVNNARNLFWMRQYDRAIEELQATLELDPNYALPHDLLGYAYEKKGMQREAIGEWTKSLVHSEQVVEAALLQRVYEEAGFEPALAALARLTLERLDEKRARGEFVAAGAYVVPCMRVGDEERAMSALEQSFAQRTRFPLEVSIDPRFDGLRRSTRFGKLVESLFSELGAS